MNNDVPELGDGNFSADVQVLNYQPIAVEKALYWNARTASIWAGGTNVTATRLPPPVTLDSRRGVSRQFCHTAKPCARSHAASFGSMQAAIRYGRREKPSTRSSLSLRPWVRTKRPDCVPVR